MPMFGCSQRAYHRVLPHRGIFSRGRSRGAKCGWDFRILEVNVGFLKMSNFGRGQNVGGILPNFSNRVGGILAKLIPNVVY